MSCRSQLGRATLAALAMMLCLAGAPCDAARPKPPPREAKSVESSEGLTPAEEQLAKAMAHYAMGVSLEVRAGFEAALPEYLQAFELDPHHTAIATRMAQFHLGREDYTNAVGILERASKAEPKSPEPWFWLGVVYRTTEESAKAIVSLQQALKLDPVHVNAIQTLLEMYLRQEQLGELAKQLDRAWKQTSDSWNYWVKLGDTQQVLVKQKPSLAGHLDANRVRQCYEKALALAPNEPEILFRLADVYSAANDNAKAGEIYAKLLKLRPDLPQVRERLAMAYIAGEQREKAVALFQDILKDEPLRYEIHNSLGGLYEEMGKDVDAIASYQLSLIANPNQLAPTLNMALLQMKLKRFSDARQTLTTAKERFPTAYQLPYFSGLIYSDEKKYDLALASFADAVALAETAPQPVTLDAGFYFYYGSAAERAGDAEKAASLFKKAIALDPKKHPAYNYLGYMWADKDVHLEEAHDLIKKAVELDPDNGAYLDSLGWVLFKLGRAEEALPQLRRAIELTDKEKEKDAGEDATLLDHLAEVLMKLGKRAEAVQTWERALKAEPDNKEIAVKLQKLKAGSTRTP